MIPNIKKALSEARLESQEHLTIACCHCKKPLWKITNVVKYGSRLSSDKEAYPGVKEYNEVWKRDGQGFTVANEDLLCPFCSEPFMKAVQAQGHVFPVPFVLELE
jgi:hypothetical protein